MSFEVMMPVLGAFSFGLLVGALFLWWWRRPRRAKTGETPERKLARAMLEYECTQCGRPVVDSTKSMRKLRGTEVGLVIRDRPDLVGRPLAEHVCPYCEATHCFLTDKKPPQWIGMNFGVPQGKGRRCLECNKTVANPPWPGAEWDGRVREAPGLHDDLGLICSRCGALSCVGCCDRYTRSHRNQGEILCPRCDRGPVNVFFHP